MNFRPFSIFLAASLLVGCVAQKKYDELLAERVKLEADYNQLETDLGKANSKIDDLQKAVAGLDDDVAAKTANIEKLETELQSLKEEHAQLETYYNNVLTSSGKLSRDLEEQQARLLVLQETLAKEKLSNEELSADLAEREIKVGELEKILEEKERAVQALMSSVKEALLNFSDSDLSVEIKNGKVYVSLAEQLLFQSGSYRVDPKGETALIQLAQALQSSPDISVLVEGHTDDVPIATKEIKDNWDLSVLRATSITRVLVNAGVPPEQVTCAGRGEFQPVTTNATPDGRQKNRRTEIILSPKLDELFSILETN